MSFRNWFGLGMSSMVVVLLALGVGSRAHSRPNIVFVFSDDHACQAISAYGSKINQTPHLDRLAREGMLFDRCVVTNSICGPSRACILTGKYSHLNGFARNGDHFDGSQQTFPKLLQQAGYQTAVVGKWHLSSEPTGFDYWKVLPGQGRYYSPEFVTPEGRQTQRGYTSDVITDEALAWLESKRDAERPFMLMLQHKAPHREWLPGPDHAGDYLDQEIPEPATLFDDYANRSTAAKNATMRIADHMKPMRDLKLWPDDDPYTKRKLRLMSDEAQAAWKEAYAAENEAFWADPPTGKDVVRWNYQRYIKDYLRCVASVDDSVGRVLDYLDAAGLADDTIVIYSSDQGFYLGEHGWYDKRFMYEESFRTPLIVRWPGEIEPGSHERRIVSNLDFAETFLDIAGAKIPADMQGRSLVPLMQGDPAEDWRTSFYYHYYEGPPAVHTVAEHYGVATDRYKLIHYYKLGEWELFDREKDPQELNSVHGVAEYSSVRAELEAELSRLRDELGVVSDEPPPRRRSKG